jgi:hypothetical protein
MCHAKRHTMAHTYSRVLPAAAGGGGALPSPGWPQGPAALCRRPRLPPLLSSHTAQVCCGCRWHHNVDLRVCACGGGGGEGGWGRGCQRQQEDIDPVHMLVQLHTAATSLWLVLLSPSTPVGYRPHPSLPLDIFSGMPTSAAAARIVVEPTRRQLRMHNCSCTLVAAAATERLLLLPAGCCCLCCL